jgi:hypothetical protein
MKLRVSYIAVQRPAIRIFEAIAAWPLLLASPTPGSIVPVSRNNLTWIVR